MDQTKGIKVWSGAQGMRQSFKQKMILSPENQLQHVSFSEALGRSLNFSGAEMSGEFASMQEKLRNTAKKSYR